LRSAGDIDSSLFLLKWETSIFDKGLSAMEIRKLNAYVTQAPQKAQETQRVSGEAKPAQGQEASQEADRVKWSRGYQEMAQVKKVMMERSDIRTEQVDRVRNMVKNGSYVVEPEKIAEKMMHEHW
jgi:negative regulator of flagellin synthesis FlgM